MGRWRVLKGGIVAKGHKDVTGNDTEEAAVEKENEKFVMKKSL